jgi:hypothetical protein
MTLASTVAPMLQHDGMRLREGLTAIEMIAVQGTTSDDELRLPLLPHGSGDRIGSAQPVRLVPTQSRRGGTVRAGQAFGGKNTSVRTSMLSRGGAPGVSGLSNEVWNDSRARPSLALSCTRINSTSSGCMSEK